jgi:hypothetical protein
MTPLSGEFQVVDQFKLQPEEPQSWKGFVLLAVTHIVLLSGPELSVIKRFRGIIYFLVYFEITFYVRNLRMFSISSRVLFVFGKPFQPSLMFAVETATYPELSKAQLLHSWVDSLPYPQT